MSQCVAYLYQVTTARTTTFLDISNSFPDPRLCLLCLLFSLTRFILPPTNLNVTQISVQPLDIPIFIVFPFFSIENVLVHQSIAWVNVNESGRSSIQFLKTIARLSGTILGLVQTNNFSRGGLKQKPEIKYTMTSPHSHAMSRVWARAFAGVLSFFVDAISSNLSVVMVLLIFFTNSTTRRWPGNVSMSETNYWNWVKHE